MSALSSLGNMEILGSFCRKKLFCTRCPASTSSWALPCEPPTIPQGSPALLPFPTHADPLHPTGGRCPRVLPQGQHRRRVLPL